MFYDNKNDFISLKNRKRLVDSIGVEIGKEMGYYEWVIFYENRYKIFSRDYEWRVGVYFILLIFLNNLLFGIGVKNRGGIILIKLDGYLLDRFS